MFFKKLEELDSNDIDSLYSYIEDLYDTIPFDSKDDYIWAKNRVRHIFEILAKEVSNNGVSQKS